MSIQISNNYDHENLANQHIIQIIYLKGFQNLYTKFSGNNILFVINIYV